MAQSATASMQRDRRVASGSGPVGWHAPEGGPGGTYRIYQMDHADHIRAHCVLRCEHDEAAVAEAALLLGEYPCVEVWNEARMVRRLATSADWPKAAADTAA